MHIFISRFDIQDFIKMTVGKKSRFRKILKLIEPGLTTGASDDDLSGIATYCEAGAAYGLSTLFTAIIAFPLMATIQQM